MIEMIKGLPGHGKTYRGVSIIVKALLAGKPVATNIELVEDWSDRLARSPFRGDRRRARRAGELRALHHYSDDFDELLRVRARGSRADRLAVVLDEIPREINARNWEQESREARVRWFSAHRHYGALVYLLTQAEENIDAQVRRNVEFVTEVKNLRRVCVLGVPICPVNYFVAVRRWNDKARTKQGVSMYGLDRRTAALYGTHALLDRDMPPDAIWLPKQDGEPKASAGGLATTAERSGPPAGSVLASLAACQQDARVGEAEPSP